MDSDLGDINRTLIEKFREGGEIPGFHRERLILLTTVGARTGQRHTTPMMFDRDGDRLLVMASANGAPKTPDWYHNLVANPRVSVEVGDETYDAVAEPATGAEQDRLWHMITDRYPFFAEHRTRAGRDIPIVVLNRVAQQP